MNVSSKDPAQQAAPRSTLPVFLIYALGLVIMLLLAQVGWHKKAVIWYPTTVQIHTGTPADYDQFAPPGEGWEEVSLRDLTAADQVFWLRMPVQLNQGELAEAPYGLFLSGLFSAEVYWDGQNLGSKGEVDTITGAEAPGPIESIVYLPAHHTTPGSHVLALKMSTQHIGYQVKRIFHGLAIGEFQTDPRRELSFYAPALLLSGGFLVFFLVFLFGIRTENPLQSRLLAFFCVTVLLQLAAESSRSLTAYTYDWHIYRSLGILLCACLSGLTLNLLVCARSKGRGGVLAGIALLGAGLAVGVARGFDFKTVIALISFSAVPILGAAHSIKRRRIDPVIVLTAMLVLAWVVGGWFASTAFLDRGFYLVNFVFLAAVWRQISGEAKQVLPVEGGVAEAEPTPVPEDEKPNEPQLDYFPVQSVGKLERVPLEQVMYLHAEGNYTELVTEDGTTQLHQLRLGQIMENPPRDFFRVHRSYAVNLSKIKSLHNQAGSRYHVELSNGNTVPVSRNKIAELRQLMLGAD